MPHSMYSGRYDPPRLISMTQHEQSDPFSTGRFPNCWWQDLLWQRPCGLLGPARRIANNLSQRINSFHLWQSNTCYGGALACCWGRPLELQLDPCHSQRPLGREASQCPHVRKQSCSQLTCLLMLSHDEQFMLSTL